MTHQTLSIGTVLETVFSHLKILHLNRTEQPGRVFVTSFRPKIFSLMASDKPFNYHSGLWLLLSHII